MSKYLSRDFLRKLNPEVYEKAAETVKSDVNPFSCDAIGFAAYGDGSLAPQGETDPHLGAYRAAFAPRNRKQELSHPFWGKGEDGLWGVPARSRRRHKRERITALLMMAAMVRYAKAH